MTAKNGKTKRPDKRRAFVLYGAGTKSRTRDPLITNQLLYQLSYAGGLLRKQVRHYSAFQIFFKWLLPQNNHH